MTLGSRRDATSPTSGPQSYQGKHEAAGLVSAPQTSAPAGTGSSAHFPSLLLQPFHSSPAVAGNPHRNAQSRITSRYKHAQPHRPSQGRCSLASVSHHTTCCLDYLQKQPPVSVPAPFFFWMQPQVWGGGTRITFYGAGPAAHIQDLPRASPALAGHWGQRLLHKRQGEDSEGGGMSPRPTATSGTREGC